MADVGARVIVPVATVAVEAYRAVFGRIAILFDLAWLPLLVMLAATLLPGYLTTYLGWRALPVWHGDSFGFGVSDLIEALAGLLCLNAFAVRWHQRSLFSGDREPPKEIFLPAWGRFLGYTLLLYVVSAALMATLIVASTQDAPPYVAPVAGLIVSLIWVGTMRCALVFPAAAYGKPLSVRAAWQIARGNTWRLFGCGIVACLPTVMALVLILGGIFAGLHLDQAADKLPLGFFILRGVIGTCANFIVVALGASVLSGFYRRIVLRGIGIF
jgi:hypothetical protein